MAAPPTVASSSSGTTTVLTSTLQRILEEGPSPAASHTVTACLVVDSHNKLGECVLYDDRCHRVVWTDIDGRKLHRLNLRTFTMETLLMPRMVGSFALTMTNSNSRDAEKNGDIYLMGWEDGFQLYHVGTNTAMSQYSKGEPVNPKGLPSRLNDGRCDRSGTTFVCGGFYGGQDPGQTMKVYACRLMTPLADDRHPREDSSPSSVLHQLHHEPILNQVQIANSTCFSPDGSVMYLSDSLTKTIRRYPYSTIRGGADVDSSFIQVDDEASEDIWKWEQSVGFPDGSCVDSEGFLWNAIWRKGDGPGRVNRIDPSTGKVVFSVHMPDSTSQCTCCCFGGDNLDVLFVTTASIDRDKEEEKHAGGMYAVKVPFTGLPEDRFRLQR